jgi:hypothetical protein
MSRRARERANARPWAQGEEPEEPQTGDWSDGCGEGDDEDQDDDHGQ